MLKIFLLSTFWLEDIKPCRLLKNFSLFREFTNDFAMKSIFAIAIFALSATLAAAFPNGAPLAACVTLSPNHGLNPPQTTPLHVRVLPSRTNIRPGDTISLLISSTTEFQFRGFLVQARGTAPPNNPLGTMIPLDTEAQVINCSGPTAATHTNRELKNSITVQWTAPLQTTTVRFQ